MKRIVIIEDDADVAEVVKVIAEKLGFEHTLFAEPTPAVEFIKKTLPDLVLLDIMMPGEINGFEVAKALRAWALTRRIPILAMSGYDSQQTQSRIFAAGADDYIAKPFDLKDLEKRIRA
ncbi:MAG: response regulator transcription factor, partial [Endomicrobiia bacterium]|nr:response regulator transcription factor [Endomicrobiia bacterium]